MATKKKQSAGAKNRSVGTSKATSKPTKKAPAAKSRKPKTPIQTFFAKDAKPGKGQSTRLSKFVRNKKTRFKSSDGKQYETKRLRFRFEPGPDALEDFERFIKRAAKNFNSRGWKTWVDIPKQAGGSMVGSLNESLNYISSRLAGEYKGTPFRELRLIGIRQLGTKKRKAKK